MKKAILVLLVGLLLSGNAYAASKFTYLSCPSVIYINDNKGKYKDSELFKVGTYIGHSFIKFKDTKKKWTTVTLYSQGYAIPPGDPDIWMSFPPTKLLKEKFLHTGNNYSFILDNEGKGMSWIIMKKGKQWNLLQTTKLREPGIDITTNSTLDWKNYCETVDKQEFNKLIKEGIE